MGEVGKKTRRTTIFGNDRLGFFKTTLLPKKSKNPSKPKTQNLKIKADKMVGNNLTKF